MKRIAVSLIVISTLSCLFSNAQPVDGFAKGNALLSIGYGLGTVSPLSFSSKVETSNRVGPIYIKSAYAVTAKTSLGLNVAYTSFDESRENISFLFSQGAVTHSRKSSVSALARLNHQIKVSPRCHIYAGAGGGLRSNNVEGTKDAPGVDDRWRETRNMRRVKWRSNVLGFEATGGMRYYLSPKAAFYVEAGLAKSVLQSGLSLVF